MESLVNALLSNALTATGLALAPLALSRFGRSPALVHSLWLVVLLKLVTPPLVQVPLIVTSPTTQANPSETVNGSSRGSRSQADRSPANDPKPRSVSTLNGTLALKGMSARNPRARPELAKPMGRAVSHAPRPLLQTSGPNSPMSQPHCRSRLFLADLTQPSPWEVLALVLNLAGCLVCWALAADAHHRG